MVAHVFADFKFERNFLTVFMYAFISFLADPYLVLVLLFLL